MIYIKKIRPVVLALFFIFFYALNSFAQKSPLSSGTWHKISIIEDGIYNLTPLLIEQFGDGIELNKIQLYGNGKGMLSEVIAEADKSILTEIPLLEIDKNQNGLLDGNDQVLFFGLGPHQWNYDSTNQDFTHEYNIYRNENFYFFTHGLKNGKRLQNVGNGAQLNPTRKIHKHKFLVFHEQDEVNVAKSGRMWVGDEINSNRPKIFTFDINNLVKEDTIFFRSKIWVRSLVESSYSLKINGLTKSQKMVYKIPGSKDNIQAQINTENHSFKSKDNQIEVSYTYSIPDIASRAWIDYIELVASRNNILTAEQEVFLFPTKTNSEDITISFQNLANEDVNVWDITDFNSPKVQSFLNGTFDFNVSNTKPLRKYISFSNPRQAEYVGKIENQNLMSISATDYLMIYHPNFKTETERLAEFHRNQYAYDVKCINIFNIYNEFSSGGQDVVAIRNFIKSVYDKGAAEAKPLRYVLFMGDASYDFKERLDGNTNFVPSYQSINSIDPIASYPSDDFFAILEDDEGYWGFQNVAESLDIGVGRFPVKTAIEAKTVVDKIIHYHQSETFGKWRNNIVFLGDDEDGNKFFNDVENFSNEIYQKHPEINVQKIYLDAYPQVSFGSGNKYPEVNDAVNRSIEQGTLIFNYIGHGGGNGMAHERVVTRAQINEWKNYDKLPLFVTATCELSQHDDPAQVSPGELILLNPNGGAIGLITTSRVVTLTVNRNLNDKIYRDNIFAKKDGERPSLGDVFMKIKNNSFRAVNQRNFILLGDPGMQLAYPKKNVFITHVNGQKVEEFKDTIGALGKVSIEGIVADNDSIMISNYDGTLNATVFDKFQTFQTLGNDPGSKIDAFSLQNSSIYNGRTEIQDGKFKFSFIVPKDISYQFGKGKISLYAFNTEEDANGFENQIVVGGSSDESIFDTMGPQVRLFLNDSTWKNGGFTNPNPTLLADIYDINGINTVGSGIGKDIVAILDKNTEHEQLFILNDYYRANLNSYQSGKIKFPLSEIAEGEHTIHLKVWDVSNNSFETKTNFVVGAEDNLEIAHVKNFPNPFSTSTQIQFEHNQAGKWIEVDYQIYSIAGKKVFNTKKTFEIAPTRVVSILWEGQNNNEQTLESGTYFCRILVKDKYNRITQKTLKLIILR